MSHFDLHHGLLARDRSQLTPKLGLLLLEHAKMRVRGNVSLDALQHDIRYGLRQLRKNPGFTAIAILTLAIGIGANTAIFSVVHAVLLRPLPFRDPSRLVLLTERMPNIPVVGPSYQNFVDWRAQSRSFESMAASHITTLTLTGTGEPERLQAQMITANLLPMLGVQPSEGRAFTPAEDRAGATPVALISYGLWQRRFGGSRLALGRSLTLDNQAYQLIGILPRGYQLIQPADVVVPFEPWASRLPDDRSWHPGIVAVGRLAPGASIQSARAEMTTIASRLERQYPLFNTGVGAGANGLQDQLVHNARPALLVLLGAVALVLLVACTNVANLLLSRAVSRRREIAVRSAIGAGRLRILRQLLTESMLLALAGGLAGLAVASLAIEPLIKLAGNSVPNVGPIELDPQVLWFTLALVLATGLLFGIAPAFQTARLDPGAILNEGARGSTSGAGQRKTRGLLVVAEIALALILLVGAGLLMRSFQRLQDVQPGFTPGNLLIAELPLSQRAHPQSPERMAFFDRVLERARLLPGVRSAGAAAFLPVSGGGSIIHFNIQARPPKTPHDYIMVGYRPVSPRYLDTLHVPLIKGRLLRDDDTEQRPFVAVVNQAMERRFFPGESAIGKFVQLGTEPDKSVPYMQIVGVVGDMKQNLATDAKEEMYLPYRQADTVLPVFALSVVLRTENDPRLSTSAFRAAVRELDPDQPVVKVRTMEENISASVSEPRFRTVLLAIFAFSAMTLAAIGLYGVIGYSVTQRRQELGIRIALGAQRRDLLKMVIGHGLRMALIGVAIGLAGAFALSRVLSRFLYGVTAADPATYGWVASLLMAVTLLACYIPARRATEVDPTVALRGE